MAISFKHNGYMHKSDEIKQNYVVEWEDVKATASMSQSQIDVWIEEMVEELIQTDGYVIHRVCGDTIVTMSRENINGENTFEAQIAQRKAVAYVTMESKDE